MRPDFYDENDTESWLKVVGEGRHYHFGDGPEIIRRLYRYIPEGSRVLDCGCGWGGPASMLVRERGCSVTGVTISAGQHAWLCAHAPEISVIHADLADFVPRESFDVAMFVQSFTHMPKPVQVLKNIDTPAVVIQDFLGLKGHYYDPVWQMHFHAMPDYERIFAAAGYRICSREVMDDVASLATIRKDAETWLARMETLSPSQMTGQIRVLRDSSRGWLGMQQHDAWCQVIFHLERQAG
ncbi:MAG: SAM-dependent methyltransferase [Pseudomonadota bacterium]